MKPSCVIETIPVDSETRGWRFEIEISEAEKAKLLWKVVEQKGSNDKWCDTTVNEIYVDAYAEYHKDEGRFCICDLSVSNGYDSMSIDLLDIVSGGEAGEFTKLARDKVDSDIRHFIGDSFNFYL